VIYVYGDDSADEKKERVSAVSVIAGYEEWWQDLQDKWVVRTAGIPFHANACESDHGDYEGKPHRENKELYRDLATLLAESKVGGIGIAIDLVAQRKIFPHSLQLAYYKAFLDCLERVTELAKNLREVAKLTFDISTENEYNAALLYKTMRDGDSELLEWLHPEISFVPWRESPRVQAADLLAYEAMKALDHTVGPVKRRRASWDALRATQRFETYSYSEQWFIDLKANIDSGSLKRKVNFDQGDYVRWLKERNRHHDLTNLFLFIDWIRKRDDKEGV